MARAVEEIKEYVIWQCQEKCEVLSVKPEQDFNDLGINVRVWNVKTDKEGDWWVVEGDGIPMNLYTQNAYYFSADEVYSFHMGIIQRLLESKDEYDPEKYVSSLTLGAKIAPYLFRKLKSVATLIDNAQEIEDFQAIGVQCREVLIELGNHIYEPYMSEGNDQPKGSDFKHKAEKFVKYYLKGSENADYRTLFKKITEATWDYANKLTHSKSATFYEASTCVSLCTSLVGAYENIYQKITDIISKFQCSNCKSKKLSIIDYETNNDGIIEKVCLSCEECGNVTDEVLEKVEIN